MSVITPAAADALMAKLAAEAAEEEPKIEDSVQVYLRWRDSESVWEVDDTTFNSGPLESPYGQGTDLGSRPNSLPENWRREWENAEKRELPDGIEVFAMLGLAAVCNDGETQSKLRELHVAQANAAGAVRLAGEAAEGGSTDDELEALGEAIEATQGALDAALVLLRMAGLLSPEA